jgi:hypothetical protein
MTTRALFWCGYAKPPPGRLPAAGAADDAYADAVTLGNDLEFAIQAARNLGVKDEDMYAFVCDRDLVPAGYAGEWRPPTCAAFEQTTSRLARVVVAGDATLFFATNHAVPEGLLTSAHVDEFEEDAPIFLAAETLAAALDVLPGVQVLVIATCFAGAFLPLARADRRLVLAACADEVYYAGGATAWAGFPAELFRAWCGVSPDGGPCPARMDPDAAFTFAEVRVMGGAVGRPIQPVRAGSVRWPG